MYDHDRQLRRADADTEIQTCVTYEIVAPRFAEGETAPIETERFDPASSERAGRKDRENTH
jgi:hypothetical protein